jgi:hypothetical protein
MSSTAAGPMASFTLTRATPSRRLKLGISESSPQDSPVAGTVLTSLTTGKSKWANSLLLGAGSASTPTYATSGDPDTGGYSVGADIWGISAGTQLIAQFKRSGSGLLGVKIGSGTFSQTIGGDGDLFVSRGLNVGGGLGAASGEIRSLAGLYLNNQTVQGLIAVTLAAAFPNAAAIVQSASPIGLLFVSNNFDGSNAIFSMRGGNVLTMIAGDAGIYSATNGAGSRLNIYRDSATGKIFYQNNISGTITLYGLAWTNVTS